MTPNESGSSSRLRAVRVSFYNKIAFSDSNLFGDQVTFADEQKIYVAWDVQQSFQVALAFGNNDVRFVEDAFEFVRGGFPHCTG